MPVMSDPEVNQEQKAVRLAASSSRNEQQLKLKLNKLVLLEMYGCSWCLSEILSLFSSFHVIYVLHEGFVVHNVSESLLIQRVLSVSPALDR